MDGEKVNAWDELTSRLRAGNYGADSAAPSSDILHIPKISEKNACLHMRHHESCGLSSSDDD
jgi:hypothetical protein